MKLPRIAPLFIVPALVALAAPSPGQQIQRAGSAHPIDPIEVELAGVGRGTMILPGLADGFFVAHLVDSRSLAEYRLEASVTPYYFYAEHAPAGAIQGVLYAPLDSSSKGEPRLVATVEGEWAIDSDGVGVLVAQLLRSEAGVLSSVGLVDGSFHTEPIAPPILPGSSSSIVDASSASSRASAAHAVQTLAQATSASLRSPSAAQRVGGAQAAGSPTRKPTIVVDSIPSPPVTRVRLSWSLIP